MALTARERVQVFEALKADDDPTEAPLSAIDDRTLVDTLVRFARVQLGQRLEPSRIDPLWAIEPARRDVPTELAAARREGRLASWLSSLEPPHDEYRRLAAERCRYQPIVDGGGWRPLPAELKVREGDEQDGVAALRVRLAIEGYRLPPSDPRRFDAGLAAALRTFQRRHDLEEDGLVGPRTRAALDVPAEERLAQIDANLERWRWMPHALPADRVEVDVGGAQATLFRGGKVQLSMRAIVGDPQHRTPMFASRLEAVVFNPPWNVPASIARNEILPKAARDPGYLARNDFVQTAHGLQQRPGPRNALGRLKFDLPSPFGVYLHDTPGKAAFQGRVRTLSHGCMRLEKPVDLAEQLLGWSRAEVEAAIDAGDTRRAPLPAAVPLFVIYRTAVVDADGWVVFRPDPYRWDGKLVRALAGAETRPSPARPASECSQPKG